MKWTNRAVGQVAAITALALAVVVLGYLQYRWAGEIGRAEQQRLRTELGSGVRNFEQTFAYDFERLCESFEIQPQASARDLKPRIRRQYLGWSKATSQPQLLDALYIWDGRPRSGPEKLEPGNRRFRRVAWPKELESLQGTLSRQARNLPPTISDREAFYYPWTLYGDIPALVRPLFRDSGRGPESGMEVVPAGFLVLQISKPYLVQDYLPKLVDRNFAAAGFGVAIRASDSPQRFLYRTEGRQAFANGSADAVVNLTDLVTDEARRRGHAALQPSVRGGQWQLVVQNPGGSTEFSVAAWRRRNLAISFGLLGILAGSMVLTLAVARRAERLARLQMEFVAGVSHELCTPLAVIGSAAENLADGVVEQAGQVREYGGMIRDQSRRLEQLVDEVLLFSAGRFGQARYELRAVDVGEVVSQTLAALEGMLRESRFAVEREIGNPLPTVLADPDAVGKCLGNLVSNSLKYAGAKRWIAVRARSTRDAARPEVRVEVEDQGIGIAAGEQNNIFKPFYRISAVRNGETRGVGLGLYLVKQMMEAMGGSVSVASEVGRGTMFTLHFPVAGTEERR